MRLHRFFIEGDLGGKALIISKPELLHQWKNVFRYKDGQRVVLFNGSLFEYEYIINSLSKDEATLEFVEEKSAQNLIKRKIWLCPGIVKGDNFEWVVEKATEIGVSRITPIISDRSEKKDIKLDRLKKIMTEASEQSGRINLVEIDEPVSLADLFNKASLPEVKIALHPKGESLSLLIDKIKNESSVIVFVGPEGGFTDKEIEIFKRNNANIVSLGEQILKAETASIVASSLLIIGN
jgi:16S rRNA (uracil1498-N3)-methyltransferase